MDVFLRNLFCYRYPRESKLFIIDERRKRDEVQKILSRKPLLIEDYRNGYNLGKSDEPSEEQVLFNSIPYDKWWKVSAKDENNKPVKVQCISLIDGAFLGVEFEKEGLYQLEFRYSNPFHYIAITISLSICSVLLFVVICISSKDSRILKKRKGNSYGIDY